MPRTAHYRKLLIGRVALAAIGACAVLGGQIAEAQQLADDASDASDDSVEIPVRLLDRSPFDRVTLDAENGNAVIETVLLELPNRRLPDNLPVEGELALHRLSEPSIPYAAPWSAVARIELYEQMLLAEAERLTDAGAFDEAFEYLAFLATNYPDLPGLPAAEQTYLWKEASAAFADGRAAEAWPILVALHARNPGYPRLPSAVQAVSDALIAAQLKAGNYSAARSLVDAVDTGFAGLELTNAARWRERFQRESAEQVALARSALAEQDYDAARRAAAQAAAIMPAWAEATRLAQEIEAAAPEVRVGVSSFARSAAFSGVPEWAAARVAPLVNPTLLPMVTFGAEGGVYRSPLAAVSTADDGLASRLTLTSAAASLGITPDAAALQLAAAARPDDDRWQPDFAAFVRTIALDAGRDVRLAWQRPPLRPEALVHLELRRLAPAATASLWYDGRPMSEDGVVRYARQAADPRDPAPQYIVERSYADDEALAMALVRRDVDVIDRVPPWHVARLRAAANVTVTAYRLPTVHVLIPNVENPLLDICEFRRALCYAIDRAGIVRDMFLGGQQTPGFQAISAPLPAAVELNDPVGYAYDEQIAARPYEPRLGALLAKVARVNLAKREAQRRRDAGGEKEAPAAPPDAAQGGTAESANSAAITSDAPADDADDGQLPPLEPLVLVYPPDPLARVACLSIEQQLELVGLPIELRELPADPAQPAGKFDLRYAELVVAEPLVDARRLFGAGGVAGKTSALMDAALDGLNRAENWNEARDRLKQIHRLAHHELPLIPLWQTVNYAAHRTELSGFGATPVTLYQNVDQWRRSLQ